MRPLRGSAFFQKIMDYENELYRQNKAREQEQKRRERQKKWDERGKRFWSTFLFTENGKPKSGFLVYSFCLSVVFIGLYLVAFAFIPDLLAPLTASWPVFWGNLLGSLCVSIAVLLVGWLLHVLLSDKRLIFGTYIWLALYVAAAFITMAVILRSTGAMREFTVFAVWFLLIPLVCGLTLFFFLCRRDYHPETPAEGEPEWKKYTRRR